VGPGFTQMVVTQDLDAESIAESSDGEAGARARARPRRGQGGEGRGRGRGRGPGPGGAAAEPREGHWCIVWAQDRCQAVGF